MKENRFYICIIIFIIVLQIYLLGSEHSKWINKIKEEKILTCYIGTDLKIINPDKIVDFDEITKIWTFTNGYARHCKISDKYVLINENGYSGISEERVFKESEMNEELFLRLLKIKDIDIDNIIIWFKKDKTKFPEYII